MSWCHTYRAKTFANRSKKSIPFFTCAHTHTPPSGSNFLSQRNIKCHFQPWFSNKSPQNHTFRLEGTCGVTSSNWHLRAYCWKQSPASIFTATTLFHLALRWRATNSVSTERICSDSTTSKCLQLCSLRIKNKLFFFLSYSICRTYLRSLCIVSQNIGYCDLRNAMFCSDDPKFNSIK